MFEEVEMQLREEREKEGLNEQVNFLFYEKKIELIFLTKST